MLSAIDAPEASRCTYVNRPESFPHMVAGEEVRDTGELVEELIFKAKEWCWSDDGCFGIDLASDLFGLTLDCVSSKPTCAWRPY